jgi:hypothetical protein
MEGEYVLTVTSESNFSLLRCAAPTERLRLETRRLVALGTAERQAAEAFAAMQKKKSAACAAASAARVATSAALTVATDVAVDEHGERTIEDRVVTNEHRESTIEDRVVPPGCVPTDEVPAKGGKDNDTTVMQPERDATASAMGRVSDSATALDGRVVRATSPEVDDEQRRQIREERPHKAPIGNVPRQTPHVPVGSAAMVGSATDAEDGADLLGELSQDEITTGGKISLALHDGKVVESNALPPDLAETTKAAAFRRIMKQIDALDDALSELQHQKRALRAAIDQKKIAVSQY